MQAEHNSSQNALFELSSQREERETARQHEAEQAATDLEEAHKKLRHDPPLHNQQSASAPLLVSFIGAHNSFLQCFLVYMTPHVVLHDCAGL